MQRVLIVLMLLISLTLVPSYAIPGGQEVINDGGGSGEVVETTESEGLSFEEYNQIKKKQEELNHIKSVRLPSFINVMLIVAGSAFVIFAICLVLAYWFDIFNTFTSFSILYYISFKNLYPVSNKDDGIIVDVNEKENGKGTVELLDFSGVLKRFFVLILFGILLMETNRIWGLLVKVYFWVTSILT